MTVMEEFFFPHTVLIRDMIDQGGEGSSPGPARSSIAETIDERTLVKNRDNVEVVSNSRVTVPLATNVAPGALVTVWPGKPAERNAEVIRVGRDENAAPLPSHLILWLT